VTSIIDDNYGLAVVKFAGGHDRYRAIVLFDTCDLWIGEHTATELKTSLGECMKEGDHVKVRALLVPESENSKMIRYLATGIVCGRNKAEVRTLPLPDQEKLEHIDNVHPDKLNNFYQVVSVVCDNLPGSAEDEVKGVSTDEEDVTVRPPPRITSSGHEGYGRGGMERDNYPHAEGDNVSKYDRTSTSNSQEFSRASLLSIDKFEEERETKKAAKAQECTVTRRKVSYDKALREKLLNEMKLPNQLLWKCKDCQISCAKPGMEKHINLKQHWDKVLENYNRKLDMMTPSSLF